MVVAETASVQGNFGLTFAYREMVGILSEAFGATTKETVISLQGRLKSYQKLGFAPPSPGRGHGMKYDLRHIYDLALCLTFASFGLPPRLIVKSVEPGVFVDRYIPAIVAAYDSGYQTSRVTLVFQAHLFFDYVDKLDMRTLDAASAMPLNEFPRPCCIADLTDVYERVRRQVPQAFGDSGCAIKFHEQA